MDRIEEKAKLVRAYAAEYECTLTLAMQELIGDGQIDKGDIAKVRAKLGLTRG